MNLEEVRRFAPERSSSLQSPTSAGPPSWIIAGLATDLGSSVSHGAVVAREVGYQRWSIFGSRPRPSKVEINLETDGNRASSDESKAIAPHQETETVRFPSICLSIGA